MAFRKALQSHKHDTSAVEILKFQNYRMLLQYFGFGAQK